MTKFIKKCFWFLALLLLMNMLYLGLLLNNSPSFKKVYNVSNFQNQNYEILVLGNSMALDGIDAGYLASKGIKTYNMAIAGSHVSNSLLLLEDYLKHNAKPKMVMIGLSSSIGRGYLNPVAYKNPEVTFFYEPSLKENVINPPLLNFQWLAVDMFKILVSKEHRNAAMVLGQWKTKRMIPDYSVYINPKIPKLNYTNPYLEKIISICEAKGINVILTELPASNSNRNSLPFEYQVSFKNGKVETVYNLNNYDLSKRIIDPNKDWLAPDHLNEYGGKKITDYLYQNVLKKELANPLNNTIKKQ
jgi:hypothetical protein